MRIGRENLRSLLERKKALVFDWDGTLFDSMKYKRTNIVRIFSGLGAEAADVERLHGELSGIPRRELFNVMIRRLFARDMSEAEYEDLSRSYTQLNNTSSEQARLFDDVSPALAVLAGGFLLFVSSSAVPEELLPTVRSQPVFHLFSGVYGSEADFTKGAAHIGRIRSHFGFALLEFLFIGDDVRDMDLAAAAGVDALRIVRDAKPRPGDTDRVISSLGELTAGVL